MSYQTYITEAIVLQSYEHNTADKAFRLFTRHAGVILATARSVREERSRQRYALQDYSYISVSLVRGKAGWRIGSTEAKQNLFLVTDDRAVRRSVLRLLGILRQYIQGEEAHPELFDECMESIKILLRPDLTNRVAWEDCFIARILYRLGYVASSVTMTSYLTCPSHELVGNDIARDQILWQSLIDQAQHASHLGGG
jgi:recombinational DNA repair protein (RecF pathway)